MTYPFTNHLIREKSPYLLAHAHNPVDWYPWCREAFQKAESENKPVFLSIGYSTCHWCHVMEQESFENPEAAALLNRFFVSVKVDREERPDIDSVYMSVCQAVNGSGGWPLTIIMTPDQHPFFAATYLPLNTRGQTPGLLQILRQIAGQWQENPDRLRQAGTSVTRFLNEQARQSRDSGQEGQAPWPDREMLRRAASHFLQTFDQEWGGFGQAPKFPSPHNLLFLLAYGRLEQNRAAEYMAAQTLFSMMRGGIFDHIGGGFSRYSTDRQWLIPHFEKMLYDNALLAMAYLECWRQTGADWCLWTACRIFTYVFRELTGEEGEFYCGQDADSEGEEGKYYGLRPEEILTLLGQQRGEAFCARYGITEEGNFQGSNIPSLLGESRPWLPDPGTEADREKVYQYRLNRYSLQKDDKALTSWNSLMLLACAGGISAARCLPREQAGILASCRERADRCLSFLRRRLVTPEGRLMARYRDGQSAGDGHLDDYAFYTLALLELYAAEFDVQLLKEACRTARMMVRYFFDQEEGGFYLYASDSEQLICRPKDAWDGAMPSGNSAAAMALCRLAALTARPEWTELRDRQLRFLTGEAQSMPSGFSFALLAMTEVLYPNRQLVCVLPAEPEEDLLRRLAAARGQNLQVLMKTPENAALLEQLAPCTASYPIEERGKYYLCENGSCMLPADSLEEALA